MDCRIPKPREGPLAAPLCSAFAGYCRGAHSRAPVTARHPAALATLRHGAEDGSVTLGSRSAGVRRPRVRAAGGSGNYTRPRLRLVQLH
jgi:hypothetical protein